MGQKNVKRNGTLMEAMGFKDMDLRTWKHDEGTLLFSNENVIKLLIRHHLLRKYLCEPVVLEIDTPCISLFIHSDEDEEKRVEVVYLKTLESDKLIILFDKEREVFRVIQGENLSKETCKRCYILSQIIYHDEGKWFEIRGIPFLRYVKNASKIINDERYCKLKVHNIELEKPLVEDKAYTRFYGFLDIYFQGSVALEIEKLIDEILDQDNLTRGVLRARLMSHYIDSTISLVGFIEVKTNFDSLGGLIRELKYYQEVMQILYGKQYEIIGAVGFTFEVDGKVKEVIEREGFYVLTPSMVQNSEK